MKRLYWLLGALGGLLLVSGCETPTPPGVERGPDNTIAYDVLVQATPPGAAIRANGQEIGTTPVHLKIFGDRDGTFHDFGSSYYVVEALPVATNQYPQVRYFGTGHLFGPEDRIPQSIYFDMNQPPQQQPPVAYPGGPAPGPYVYPYPVYPYPYPYWGGPRIYIGPGYGYRHWR
ncbi:MAG TPA: hypothetical protein VFB72_02510 [Verrucomicrobiae bacterium]|nr:hypothetical protein [Verrucomicrobiae bacterium]